MSMLNYNYTQSSITVSPQSGPKITAYSEMHWTSGAPNQKEFKVFVAAQGELRERGASWTEEWVFAWPDENLKKLEDGLRLIGEYVEKRDRHSEKRREAFVDIYDWLRVGWIDEGEQNWKGYLKFSKDGKSMLAEFGSAPALYEFRAALLRALNP